MTKDDEVTVMVGNRVSIAEINTRYGSFIGEAKRAPGDRWNQQVGYNLAYGRALQNYGCWLEDQGLTVSDVLCEHTR